MVGGNGNAGPAVGISHNGFTPPYGTPLVASEEDRRHVVNFPLLGPQNITKNKMRSTPIIWFFGLKMCRDLTVQRLIIRKSAWSKNGDPSSIIDSSVQEAGGSPDLEMSITRDAQKMFAYAPKRDNYFTERFTCSTSYFLECTTSA